MKTYKCLNCLTAAGGVGLFAEPPRGWTFARTKENENGFICPACLKEVGVLWTIKTFKGAQ